ncbi:competence type IV pilus assembly protein ComGB [Bhargavaea ullalensis]|uniref:competence type IV pilus assembly protein ComGB n=1 Tax=Bhargavaea ullalensis TaxID=1265685 RepID=UPI003399A466
MQIRERLRAVRKTRPKKRIRQPERLLQRASGLMGEGYTFHDSIRMLLPHHLGDPGPALLQLERNLRSGLGPVEILEGVGFSRTSLMPVGIAVEHGNLPEALGTMADKLRRRGKTMDKLKKATVYPAILFGFITILFILFRLLFMPNMERLLGSRGGGGAALDISGMLLKLPDLLFGAVLAAVLAGLPAFFYWKKQTPARRHRLLLSVPLAGRWQRMAHTAVFSREMGTLLIGGISLQHSLRILSGQAPGSMLEHLVDRVESEVVRGSQLHKAVGVAGGFTEDFSSFIRHGEEGGHLPRELLIYGELLDEQIEEESEKLIAVVQPVLFSILAVCILGAYLALMLPVYSMIDIQ